MWIIDSETISFNSQTQNCKASNERITKLHAAVYICMHTCDNIDGNSYAGLVFECAPCFCDGDV